MREHVPCRAREALALLATIAAGSCAPDDSRSVLDLLRDMGSSDLGAASDAAGWAWTPQTSGTGQALLAVWGSSASDIWAVGQASTILHTTNGGITWSAVTPSLFAGDWGSVGGSSANDLFIVSTTGVAIHSGNGGTSWTEVSPPSREATAVLGFSSGDVYVLGSGDLAHTSNGGSSWNTLAPPTGGHALLGVWGASPAELYVTGAAGLILYTADGGATWTTKIGPTAPLNGVAGTSNGSDVYIVGGANSILHTKDHGVTWTLQTSPLPPGTTFSAVTVPDGGEAIALGAIGDAVFAAIASTDGGATWRQDDLGTTYGLQGIWSAGPRDVYAVGGHGTILHAR
jgi:photosystem II stability/assembly factor-like uncharacterized protein